MATNRSNGQLTAQVKIDPNAKSGFDLGFHNYGTGKIGRIIPTRAQKVHPNDNINTTSMAALQFEPLAVPIMAKMEQKQEHFYVPYNVVWKDWDEFISNGEDNSFNGVAPTTNLKNIMDMLADEKIPSLFQLKLIGSHDFHSYMGMQTPVRNFRIDSTNSTGYGPLSDHIMNIRDEFESQGTEFMAKDIFKYVDECILNLTNLCKGTNYTDYKDLFLMCKDGNAYRLYDEMVNKGLITSKYITNMKDWYRSLGNAERNYTSVIPTDEAVIFAKCLYDFIKPLVGLGSNYDYLNIGRITLEEFLFSICYNLQHTTFLDYGEYDSIDGDESIFKYETQGDFTKWNDEPIVIFNLRANYAVWYHNYRDPILEADAFKPINTSNISNQELLTLLIPRQRCWEKDAFTTALDNPGTGNVGVPVNIQSYKSYYQEFEGDNARTSENFSTSDISNSGNSIYEVHIGDSTYRVPSAFLMGMNKKPEELVAEESVGFSLYQLDACQRAQSWLQKMLYFGNRIQDFYYLRFGVRFLDARLRLPELISSSSNLVSIDTIMNNTNITTEVNGQTFQTIAGDRAGYASVRDDGNFKDRYVEEHGVLLSYLTVLPVQSYGYGRSRDYSRTDMFDYAFSEFATLGMDAIYSTELAVSSFRGGMFENTQLDPHPEIFGYQGRYYDYKAQMDEEHGEMLDSQDMYTFGREFKFGLGGKPRLNYEFVHCFPNLDMFVVNSRLEDYFRYDVYHRNNCERQLPAHSVYIK